MIVEADVSGQGTAKGYLEYSSTMVRRKRFLLVEGKGPLKSRFNLSKGAVALMRVPPFLWNLGFNS